MGLRAVIFDLDGVITDTSRFHYLCWKKLADQHRIFFDEEFNERFKGVSRKDCVRMLFPEIKDDVQLHELAEQKNRYYVEMIRQITPADLFDGTRELLCELHEHGIKTAIGSASKNTLLVLQKLEIAHWFDAIADGTEVAHSKPAPDVFELCARKLRVACSQCVVVEDAQAGIQAAHAAGMTAVGVGSRDLLPEADWVVNSVRDVDLELLNRLVLENQRLRAGEDKKGRQVGDTGGDHWVVCRFK
ncbi:MAG: beta-phosphoglucomutase [Chloroflexi bacterium]|nr:beta-phosphoglucomutase [Chloroflexota bacterium]